MNDRQREDAWWLTDREGYTTGALALIELHSLCVSICVCVCVRACACVRVLVCAAQCGGSMTDVSGVILSPGYPGNYPSGLDCTWTVDLPVGFGKKYCFVKFHPPHLRLMYLCYSVIYFFSYSHGASLNHNRGPSFTLLLRGSKWSLSERFYCCSP